MNRLEQHSWRTQETFLNAELPQFRTGFTVPSSEATVRIHFIHARSSHANAVPLLLIPPFPFSNLSFGNLIKLFTEPEDAANNQPFHLIIPSLPGLGFSDALPNNTPVISSTADILNSLMSRLEYPHYLVTNASSGAASPAEIDFKLVHYLVSCYPNHCLGAHLISPPISSPELREAPIEWAIWSLANLFHVPMLGYRSEDFSALERNGYVHTSSREPTATPIGLNQLGFREPNTLAYALCDSPTGLLVLILKILSLLSPKKQFSSAEVIQFSQLAWLPGPESAMRFWANCVRHPETAPRRSSFRPRVGLTVFLGDEPSADENAGAEAEAEAGHLIQEDVKDGYACPRWAKAKYRVVYVNRAPGTSGLLAWERPELIAAGIRAVATSILKWDSRLRPKPKAQVTVVPLEQVIIQSDISRTIQPLSPPTKPDPTLLTLPTIDERGHPHREISDETAVASDENVGGKASPQTPSPVHLSPLSDE